MDFLPKRKPCVFLEEIDREGVLCSEHTDKIHALNQTALFIWNLCDGQHSIESIAGALVNHFTNVNFTTAMDDVARTIDSFRDLHLLEGS